MSTSRTNVSGTRRQSIGGADGLSKANGFLSKRPSFQMRSSVSTTTTLVNHAKGASKSFDGGCRSLERYKGLVNGNGMNVSTDSSEDKESNNSDEKCIEFAPTESEDSVSGVLYDMLQKEVIALRKACHEKDQSLKDKDDAVEVSTSLENVFRLFICLLLPRNEVMCCADVGKESRYFDKSHGVRCQEIEARVSCYGEGVGSCAHRERAG